MPRALCPTVPRSSPTAQPPLPRAVRRALLHHLPVIDAAIRASARATNADADARTFFAFSHAWFLLVAALSSLRSLRQAYSAFGQCPGLVAHAGLTPPAPDDERLGVSFSQLAWANTQRPMAFFATLARTLLATLPPHATRDLPPDLYLLDATFLYLSSVLAPWLSRRQRRHADGLKAQVWFQPATEAAQLALLTDGRRPDQTALSDGICADPAALAALVGATLVFDLGYYGHPLLAQLRAANVHFITPRQRQATIRVVESLPVQQTLPLDAALTTAVAGAITVLGDARVVVGSPTNHNSTSVPNLRLVTAQVAPRAAALRAGAGVKTYTVLTDRFDLPAEVVIAYYRLRRLIESCFKWLKSHLHLTRLLGHSPSAVATSLWMALVAHAVSLLIARSLQRDTAGPALLSALYPHLIALHDPAGAVTPPHQLQLPGFPQAASLPPT